MSEAIQNAFPRTTVGGLSVSRFIIGTNWMAGWSHTGKAADCMIKNHHHSAETLCPMLETFLNAGIDVTDSAEGRKNAEHTIRDCDMVTVGCFNEMEAAEDIAVVVCDSGELTVQQALRDSVKAASEARRERIAVVGGKGLCLTAFLSGRFNINTLLQLYFVYLHGSGVYFL